jgi:NAD-dependent dihydropyrimidine dehydrogenase PreA subunit/flavodoxin
MKIGIYYFSGTGNTALFAEHLKKGFEERWGGQEDFQIHTKDISVDSKVEDNCDLIAIGGPIYAGNMPERLIRWVHYNIPGTLRDTPAMVFSTSAGLENAFGVESISCKLQVKGYRVIAKEMVEMPRNFYFDKYKANSKEEIESRIEAAKERGEMVASNIPLEYLTGKQRMLNNKNGILLRDLLAETFSVMAKFMGKNYHATDACVQCGTCVRNCPTQNIKIAEVGTRHLSKCMMCTKCLHICPVNAIQYKGNQVEQYNQLLNR